MNKELVIEAAALQIMINSATRAFPEECCGFFWGLEEEKRTTLALEVRNVAEDKHVSFSISQQDYRLAENIAEEHQLTLLGVFHSHPRQSSLPSIEDIELAFPNLYYIIMGVNSNEVYEMSCWLLNESKSFDNVLIITNNNS